MKHSKGVYVTSRDIKEFNREYYVYANKRDTVRNVSKDFSCQYNSKRDNIIFTCERTKEESGRYFDISHQIYRSQRFESAWGYTDVGVGSVKPVPKKRVRRIYLPDTEDRGVGSEELTSFLRKPRIRASYYDLKKTSSKCVGGIAENKNTAAINEKLSPICKTKSASTSVRRASFEETKTNEKQLIIPDPVVTLAIGKKHGRSDKIDKNKKEQGSTIRHRSKSRTSNVEKPKDVPNRNKTKSVLQVAANEEKDFSSDSLVQHVHNLETPRQSKGSIDLVENKLEREYIKMFSMNSERATKPIPEVNPMQDCTSNSLKQRFEGLRSGLDTKEMSKEHGVLIKPSSHNSITSKKDVSISSDPPSLEARSYSNTKIYSPTPSHSHKYDNVPHSSHGITGEDNSHWSTDAMDADHQNVKGMFKLWGEKFNLEEDFYNKTYTSDAKKKKKVELVTPKEEEEAVQKEKKKGKRFLFFKRKNKEKLKQPYIPKTSVTAGRCEVGDGLMIKIGAVHDYIEIPRKTYQLIQEEYDNMLRKQWMKRILDSKSDSRNSVKIRWNNDMYATSSSTVFELMECIYKNTGIVLRSKSEITATSATTRTTVDTIAQDTYKNPQVNFMQQTLQAWMIPNMIVDKPINAQNSKKKKNIEVTISNQKWFIEKTKALTQKIEFVLHSKNIVKRDCESSEYLVIDIPKGYFSDSSSEDKEQCQSSDEKVYNIVEYLTAKSSSDLRKKGVRINDADQEFNNICVTVNVQSNEKESKVLEKVIKTPPLHRDVIVQGSNVIVPKRCDVIGVGIITQHTHNRDIKEIKIPRFKMQDEIITDEESTHTILPQKKCEFAESYLQDYYRNCNPLGIDLYSWCFSESNLRGSSDNNSLNRLNNQGDGSKSCPNIYDDYQTDFASSSETTSSVSHGAVVQDTKNTVDDTTAYFNKFRKKDEPLLTGAEGKRVLPKDSVEVFKRRKIYAQSKKVDQCNDGSEPFSVPSLLDKCAQKMSNESSKSSTCKECDTENSKPKKTVKQHVSLKHPEKKIGDGILSFKGSFVCKKTPCPKNARVNPEPIEISEAPCKEKYQEKRESPCSDSPSPCVPICPPTVPPSAPYFAGFPPFSPKQTDSTPPKSLKSRSSSPPKSPTPKSPPCKESCETQKKPPCSKKNSPSCLVPPPPICPAGPPSPCQPPCPPIPPPCNPNPAGKPSKPGNSLPRSFFSNLCPPRRTKSLPSSSPKSSKPFTELCGCNPQMSCGLPQCGSTKKAKITISPINSRICIKKPPSFKFTNALKRLISKCTSLTTKKGLALKKEEQMTNKYSVTKKDSKLSKTDSVTRNNSKISKNDTGDCDPDCLGTNLKKKESDERKYKPPHSTPSFCPPIRRAGSQPKMAGVHLKMKPMPRKSATECQPNCSVIKLSSKENIIIRRKTKTPSTEQIRDGCNIKVQDEDGVTLYERRDYKMDTAQTRKYLVKDMYRDSQIHRVATSKVDMIMDAKNVESSESNMSLSNIVEINLNFKFQQAVKTDVEAKNAMTQEIPHEKVRQASISEVYVLQDNENQAINRIEETKKRDVNIKIIINSYQKSPESKRKIKTMNQHIDDAFARKISEKFHTVSTGYSDVMEKQTFSVHRATVNFTDSIETRGQHIKPNDEAVSEEILETCPINLTDNGSMIKNSTLIRCDSLIAANKEVDSQVLQNDIGVKKSSKTDVENTVSTHDEKSATCKSASGTDEALSDSQHSNIKMCKLRSKEEKKIKILKQIFESSSNLKPRNTSKLRSIRKMLQAVFTSDSSGCDDVPSNKLAKEITYESLKPNFFKDTDSMTNYYLLNDSTSDKSKTDIDEILYPSEIEMSTDSEELNKKSRCLCSLLAQKLNICENNDTKICCCKGKLDEEIHCNLTEDQTICKTEYIDVKTQDSMKSQTKISSNTEKIEPQKETEKGQKRNIILNKVPKRILSYSSSIKACRINKSNTHSILGLSEDDKVVVLNSNAEKADEINLFRNSNNVKPIDILQFHETKKAVLEIYAEKTLSGRNEHLVAKLPNFLYERESDIYKYQKLLTDFVKFSERNAMMSIPR